MALIGFLENLSIQDKHHEQATTILEVAIFSTYIVLFLYISLCRIFLRDSCVSSTIAVLYPFFTSALSELERYILKKTIKFNVFYQRLRPLGTEKINVIFVPLVFLLTLSDLAAITIQIDISLLKYNNLSYFYP